MTKQGINIKMNNLPIEIKAIILDFLDYKSQIKFVFASKNNQLLIKYWIIHDMIVINNKSLKISYYDCFENILINELLLIYPKKLKSLKFNGFFKKSIQDCILQSVTKLVFGFNFDQPIKKIIPSSVTHLTFGHCFNQSVKNCIPSLVTHLTFGHCFDQPIENSIPLSVTKLVFGWNFNQSIKDSIPSSVTYLEFGGGFNQSIKNCIRSEAPCICHNPVFCKNRIVPKTIISYTFNLCS